MKVNNKIRKIADDLFLISLDLPKAGFKEFISVWLYRSEITCLIDVGPSTTIADLLRALAELKINQLDYILLTHIHLDHAGAIGEIADAFPQTQIICHQDARPHLVEPLDALDGRAQCAADRPVRRRNRRGHATSCSHD